VVRPHDVQTDSNPHPRLAIGLMDSYRITGFFLRPSNTAVIPCTVRSRAFEAHVIAEEPYKGQSAVGMCPTENREGRIGI